MTTIKFRPHCGEVVFCNPCFSFDFHYMVTEITFHCLDRRVKLTIWLLDSFYATIFLMGLIFENLLFCSIFITWLRLKLNPLLYFTKKFFCSYMMLLSSIFYFYFPTVFIESCPSCFLVYTKIISNFSPLSRLDWRCHLWATIPFSWTTTATHFPCSSSEAWMSPSLVMILCKFT